MLRDKLQFNFDPMDHDEVLTIQVCQQGVSSSEVLSDVKIGAQEVARLLDRERAHATFNPLMNPTENLQSQLATNGGKRTDKVSHNSTRLIFDQASEEQDLEGRTLWVVYDLVPIGRIWLRLMPVRDTVGDRELQTIYE